MAETHSAAAESNQEFVKGLGLTGATTLVMGSMIGSGIYIVSADVARQVKSPGLLIVCWVLGALLTIVAALSYGELAAMLPHAGGQYVYLREAFGRLWGFLYGWTLFVVIQTGTIAAVAVAFAKYTGVFFPSISAGNYLIGSGRLGVTTQQLLAIAIIVVLTWVNTRGIRTGALVQNVFTFAKVASLLGLAILGFLLGRNPQVIAENFGHFWDGAGFTWAAVALVGTAMVGPLFSSDSWNNVTFAAAEVRHPRRNLPLSLGLGVGVVSALYIACNFVYLSVLTLPRIQTAPEDRVATAVVSVMFGPVATSIMAAAIMVSTFGCLNGIILSGARVYFTMAHDRLFFRQAGRLDARTHAPVHALAMQCLWSVALTLSGQCQRKVESS
jgi:APA family basic amino acid/polyamine antiporter